MKYLFMMIALTMCFFQEIAPQGLIPFKLTDLQPGRRFNPNKMNSFIYQPSVVTFDDTIKWTYTYDNEGNNLTKLIQGWSNNNWVNEELITFTYNNAGKVLTELFQAWEMNAWVNKYRATLTYNQSSYPESYTVEE